MSQEDPLEKEVATHTSILAWRIPETEEPSGLQSMVLQESDMTKQLHSLTHYKSMRGRPTTRWVKGKKKKKKQKNHVKEGISHRGHRINTGKDIPPS